MRIFAKISDMKNIENNQEQDLYDLHITESHKDTMAVLGAGNIGMAVATALVLHNHPVKIWNRSEKRLRNLNGLDVIEATTDLGSALDGVSYVFLCVESPAVPELIDHCGKFIEGRRDIIFVSCAASISLEQLRKSLSVYISTPKIARLLPNLAATVQKSVNLFCSEGIAPEAEAETIRICQALGPVFKGSESSFAAGMALSSCGIAYAARFIRAWMSAGVSMGLNAEESKQLAMYAIDGTVALLEKHPDLHPEELIDKVCTPGGVTIAGLNEMEAHGMSAAVIAGLQKAARKV